MHSFSATSKKINEWIEFSNFWAKKHKKTTKKGVKNHQKGGVFLIFLYLILPKKRCMKPLLVFLTIFCLLPSCFSDYTKRKLEADNLVLGNCESVHSVLSQQFNLNIPEKAYVQTCGCISEILAEDMAASYSLDDLKKIAQDQGELNRLIIELMITNKQKIVKNCVKSF